MRPRHPILRITAATDNPDMQRWIMHLDMDAFYASIEQRDRPELRGLPVVVGARPGGRGVVATCSYEARRFGIRSAMPIGEARRRCPDAVFLRPDMPRYGAESRKVMGLLSALSPLVEPVSIDEAYLDISGLERLLGPPEAIGRRAKRAIAGELGLSASVGIGPNRLIAKLASDHRKPDGLTVVQPQEVAAFLAPLPVRRLRGVGARTGERLERMGIRSVAQLRACPVPLLARYLGRSAAEGLLRQAAGVASDRVGGSEGRKSISKETTFATDLRDQGRLRDVLLELAAEVGRRARREGLAGRRVTLKIRFDGFETHTHRRRLDAPTHSDREIFHVARALYREARRPGRGVRLLGVGLADWCAGGQGQMELFAPPGRRRREEELWRTLDRVAERFGSGKLRLGMRRRGPK